MITALIDGEPLQDSLRKASSRLKADRKQLMASMDEKRSPSHPSHPIILKDIRDHIDFLSDQQKKLEVNS